MSRELLHDLTHSLQVRHEKLTLLPLCLSDNQLRISLALERCPGKMTHGAAVLALPSNGEGIREVSDDDGGPVGGSLLIG